MFASVMHCNTDAIFHHLAHSLQTFTTVHDGQTEMSFMIYEGSNPVASENRLLGQFKLAQVPPAPFGLPKVKVRF